MDEQGSKPDQPMYQHLRNCEEFGFVVTMNSFPDAIQEEGVDVSINDLIYQAVFENSRVICTSRDKLQLSYLETFLIKKHRSKINSGIKAAKELQLF